MYEVTFNHQLGAASLLCNKEELPTTLNNMVTLSLCGHQFSNVTIKNYE